MEASGPFFSLLAEAFQLLKENRPAEAVQRLQKVLLSDPENFEALHYMGIARGQQGLLDEAENYLRRALGIRPDSALIRYHLGYVLYRKGALEEARWNLEEALRLDPDLTDAKKLLAEMAMPRVMENLTNFWARAASAYADFSMMLLLSLPLLVVIVLTFLRAGHEVSFFFRLPEAEIEIPPSVLFYLQMASFLLSFLVHAVPWAIWGRSPGMFAFGLRLADREGRRPSSWRVLLRWLVYDGYQVVVLPAPFLGLLGRIYANAFSGLRFLLLILNIVLISATVKKQAVHDLAAGTFVVGRRLPAWLSILAILGLFLSLMAVFGVVLLITILPLARH